MKKSSAYFDKQKRIIHIPVLLIILAVAGLAVWFFLNKGGLGTKGTTVPISPSQLMPFISAQEARTTICNLKKKELFAQVCQSKFDAVGKGDIEKISELFVLIDKIKNDKSISDYDRLLLAQVVFAALPTKDSPEAKLFRPTLVSTALAQAKTVSQAEFKQLMARDLQNMVDSLPKGDNAWVINVMVSQYSWKEGQPQPLYSHQYAEVFDPFPGNPNVDTRDITYHVQARVGSKASSQTGTSEMMAYSFTITSWKSEAFGPTEEKFLVKKENFSDTSYRGEAYLNNLLEAVKMPSPKRPTESSDKNAQKTITCEEWKKIVGTDKCKYPMIRSSVGTTSEEISRIGPPNSIWCGNSKDFGKDFEDYKDLPVDYRYDTSEEQCIYNVTE